MIIPAVMFIEMALDTLRERPNTELLEKEVRTFRTLGEGRLNQMRISDSLSSYSEVERGYVIGLETARVLLATMPNAVTAKVEI